MPLVGNISGSNGTMNVAITGSLVIADVIDASFPSIASIGTDVNLFVSGTKSGKDGSTRGVAVFGGDVVISGTLHGGSPLKVGTEINMTTAGAGLFMTGSVTSPTVDSTQSALYVKSVSGLPKLYIKNGAASEFELSTGATSAGVLGAVQFSNGASGFSSDASNFFWDSTKAVLKIANLEVTGSTFVVTSSNIKVSDPVILVGSGTLTSNSKSVIAFASGTSITNQSVIFGPTGDGSNGLSAARLDVQDGNLPYTGISYTNLVPVRASKFEVNSINTALTSSGGTLILSGTTGGIQIQHAASPAAVDFRSDTNTYFRASRDGSSNSVFDARSNKAYFSGSQLYLVASSSGSPSVTFGLDSAREFMEISSGSNPTSQNIAKIGSRTGTDLSLDAPTGRKVIFSSNNAGIAYVDSTGLLPVGDKAQVLGGPNNRWSNIYTGDLHLRNERGDYTLIEEEDCLTIRFNKTGKRYKFVLEPAPEFDDK